MPAEGAAAPDPAGNPTPIEFTTPEAFGEWLAEHHDDAVEVWVRLWKVATGKPSITWEDGVCQALAWGWIDAKKKSEGPESWLQRFTPRRARSTWSKRNRDHVERLIAEGRMQPSGLAQVEAARSDGRWQQAYAGSREMEIPADFLAALEQAPARARDTYAALDRRNLFVIYHRLTTAKRPETRTRRMAALLETLARGERFH